MTEIGIDKAGADRHAKHVRRPDICGQLVMSVGRLCIQYNLGASTFVHAPKTEFVEVFQSDFTCPVLVEKILHFAPRANHLYKPAPSRLTRGAARDRHGRRDGMRLSNRCWGVKPVISLRRAAGCMVVFAVDIGRRTIELRRTSLQCGRRTLLSQQCNRIRGMARLTSRQGHLRR